MKICHICEPMKDGVGRHVIDLAQGLAARGHEIHVIYSPLRSDPYLIEELESLRDVTSHPIAMAREPHWRDVPSLLRILGYLHRQGPFDILHGHSSKGGVYARVASLAYIAGTIYTPHAFVTMSDDQSRPANAAFKQIERMLSVLTSRVICVSSIEYRHARDHIRISPDRLAMIHNGINPRTYDHKKDLRAELGLGEGIRLIGLVGRLDPQKGADIAIRAMKPILEREPRARLVVIGDGQQRPSLLALTRDLRIEGHVVWLGQRPSRQYIHNFDVIVVPSRYDGFAYTVIEALWSGVPVVATAVGGVPEVIADGVNGYTFPVEDSVALAERVTRILQSPELRDSLSREARRYSERFSDARMCSAVEEAYYCRSSEASPTQDAIV